MKNTIERDSTPNRIRTLEVVGGSEVCIGCNQPASRAITVGGLPFYFCVSCLPSWATPVEEKTEDG